MARHPWDPNHRTDIPGDPSYQPGRTDAADDVAAVQAIELGAGIDGVAFEAMRDRARLIGGVAAAGGTIVAFSIAQGDLRNALAVGALVVGLAWLWTFDRHVSFSFGEGFLGYRAQMGWPRGVQEDDTVRWDWHVKIDDRTLDVGRPGTR